MAVYTQNDFKERWERDILGSAITPGDVIDCAVAWMGWTAQRAAGNYNDTRLEVLSRAATTRAILRLPPRAYRALLLKTAGIALDKMAGRNPHDTILAARQLRELSGELVDAANQFAGNSEAADAMFVPPDYELFEIRLFGPGGMYIESQYLESYAHVDSAVSSFLGSGECTKRLPKKAGQQSLIANTAGRQVHCIRHY